MTKLSRLLATSALAIVIGGFASGAQANDGLGGSGSFVSTANAGAGVNANASSDSESTSAALGAKAKADSDTAISADENAADASLGADADADVALEADSVGDAGLDDGGGIGDTVSNATDTVGGAVSGVLSGL